MSEKVRSRALLDLLHSHSEPADRQEQASLRQELARIARELGSAGSPARREQLVLEQHEMESRLVWFELVHASLRRDQHAASPLDAEGILQLARMDGVGPLLIYHSSHLVVWGFLILPDQEQPIVESVEMSWQALTAEVDALRQALSNPLLAAEAQRRSRRLWNLAGRALMTGQSKEVGMVGPPNDEQIPDGRIGG